MTWYDSVIDALAANPVCGYLPGQEGETEPTALASLALAGAGKKEESLYAARWLIGSQRKDGSVPVRRNLDQPRWTTSLALLAWLAHRKRNDGFQTNIDSATNWMLSIKGATIAPTPNVGHDTTLVGWPWVEGTHSWLEPTAFNVIALKATDFAAHGRTREAVRLLIDRQLPDGGCNYGNTYILGQKLVPHVQPTGIAMVALRGESDDSGVIERSLKYLQDTLSSRTTTSSLCWAILGLAAHDIHLEESDEWLKVASKRLSQTRHGSHPLALIALAKQGKDALILSKTQQ